MLAIALCHPLRCRAICCFLDRRRLGLGRLSCADGFIFFYFKRLAIIDVLTIAIGHPTGLRWRDRRRSPATVWILVCTGMLALFIALTKRRDDLAQELSSDHRESLGGYSIAFLDASFVMVSTALVVSYVVFTTDADAMHRLGSENLYLTIPFVVGGTLRQLQLTIVHRRSGSPTELRQVTPAFGLFGLARDPHFYGVSHVPS